MKVGLLEAARLARDVLNAQIKDAAEGIPENECARKLRYDAWRKLDAVLANTHEELLYLSSDDRDAK